MNFKAKCPECNRVFDLLNEDDANEWGYGHDCEILDFDDLDEETREKLIFEAFEALVEDNKVPYGVQTGDDDVWTNYEPAIELARRDYEEKGGAK